MIKRALLALAFLAIGAPAFAACDGQFPASVVCASPSGGAGLMKGRALVNGDIPSGITATKIGNGDVDATELSRINGISAFIATLIDDADATTARATLGAVIGTNVQAWDADLDTLALSVFAPNATAAAYLDFREDTDNGSNRVRLSGAQSTADVTVTLPAATDTLVGKATTDTLTNKTFDTAGAGNSFSINGLAATANTGTGSVVRDTSPALVTPALGTPTALVLTSATGLPLTTGVTGDLPFANIAQIATDRLVGRDTAATGDFEALTVGGGIEFTGSGGIQRSALSGDVVATAGSATTTIQADSVALTTDTTGNYAAGDAEAGAALTGDSATAFFSAGTIEDARIDGSAESDEVKPVEAFCVAVSDETTAITTGTAKVTWRMPYAFTLSNIRGSLNTVSSSGSPIVDINEAGTTVMSANKVLIDVSEKTSVTAVTAVAVTDTSLADDAEMTADIDTAGTGAKGLKICLIGNRT